MSLRGTAARGNTQCQNFESFFEEGEISPKEKFLVNVSDLMSKFIFLELKAFFANPISKRLISKRS